MQIFSLIALGTLFILSVIFIVLYIIAKNKQAEVASNVKKIQEELALLTQKYNYAILDLSPKRHGYYKESTLLLSKEDELLLH